MRRNKRNGQPDEGVCDIQHTVHSDELFVIRQHIKTGSQMKVCVIYSIRFTRMNYFWLGNTKETVSQIKVCAIYACGSLGPCRQCVTSLATVCSLGASSCTVATVHRLFAFPSRFGTAVARSSSLHLLSPFLLPLFDHLFHGGNRPETTPLFLPWSERWRGGGTHWSARRHHLG